MYCSLLSKIRLYGSRTPKLVAVADASPVSRSLAPGMGLFLFRLVLISASICDIMVP
jgi:hypothetical protein